MVIFKISMKYLVTVEKLLSPLKARLLNLKGLVNVTKEFQFSINAYAIAHSHLPYKHRLHGHVLWIPS